MWKSHKRAIKNKQTNKRTNQTKSPPNQKNSNKQTKPKKTPKSNPPTKQPPPPKKKQQPKKTPTKRKWCQIFSVAWIVFNPRFSNLATGQTQNMYYYQNAEQQHLLRVKHSFRVSRRVGCLRVKPISIPLESQTYPEAIGNRCCTSTPAQTKLKLICISATGVTSIKPCEALKYFTDIIRTSRSKSMAGCCSWGVIKGVLMDLQVKIWLIYSLPHV